MGALLDASCLVPDHAHLVLQITGAGLVDVIRDLKTRSTRLWWQYGGAGSLWQRSFYDRGLRTGQEWRDAVDYVIANPVRAGLAAEWADYPHLGGLAVEEAPDDLLPEPEPSPSSGSALCPPGSAGNRSASSRRSTMVQPPAFREREGTWHPLGRIRPAPRRNAEPDRLEECGRSDQRHGRLTGREARP
jgi:hypothetical protein